MQIYERVSTISEPGFSGNLIKKEKKGLLFHKCQPSLSYPFWSLSSETQLYFFSSILFCSPSHTNIYAPQTKDGSCLSHWSGNRLARSGFLGQTAPRHHGWAPCHSTSHRVSVKWVDKATPALHLQRALAPPSTPTACWSCRPVLHLPLLSETLWNWKPWLQWSVLKVTPLAGPCIHSIQIPTNRGREKKKGIKSIFSCTLNHIYIKFLTSMRNKSKTTNKRLIPSHPSPLSPLTLLTHKAVRRLERPSNTPTE